MSNEDNQQFYKVIAERSKSYRIPIPYVGLLYSQVLKSAEVRELLLDKLQGRHLFDLGAGSEAEPASSIAEACMVASYTAVDKYYTPHLGHTPKPNHESVKTDALLFLLDQSEKQRRANIMVNAMDGEIIPPGAENDDYIRALNSYMAEIVGDRHIIFGANSNRVLGNLPEFGFKHRKFPFALFSFDVYFRG